MTKHSSHGPFQAKPGAVLRSLRAQRGWTLSEVSRRTGLPQSTLSRIENDKMSLTFDKLIRISDGLGVDISRLFGFGTPDDQQHEATGRRSITRAGEGRRIDTANYSHLYPAADLLNKHEIPILVEIRARSLEEFGELISHSGQEYTFVLEGEVDLHTDLYAPVRLGVGDSIYFDSRMGHAYIAACDGPCRVLSICSMSESQLTAAREANARPEKTARRAAPRRKRPTS